MKLVGRGCVSKLSMPIDAARVAGRVKRKQFVRLTFDYPTLGALAKRKDNKRSQATQAARARPPTLPGRDVLANSEGAEGGDRKEFEGAEDGGFELGSFF